MAEQFEFVKALKQSNEKTIIVLRHRSLGTKLVQLDFNGDGSVYRLLSEISHPNLPRILGVSRSGGRCTVFEQYIDGICVSDVLKTGLYNERGVREVARGVCAALEPLHSMNIVHRDIKPENVMVDCGGTVKLIDFDAARVYKAYQSLDTSFVGTAGFAAPEQFGISQTDCRADIFALGVMMNVMLTGEHPSKKLYGGKLQAVIEKAINIDPNKRYPNVTELLKKI